MMKTPSGANKAIAAAALITPFYTVPTLRLEEEHVSLELFVRGTIASDVQCSLQYRAASVP